jgi:hypothetical protein
MLKSFRDWLAKKIGDTVWIWLGPLGYSALVSLWAWLASPDQFSVSLTRLTILLLCLPVTGFPVFAYVVGFFVAKRRYMPRAPMTDTLQRQVLCLLWSQRQNAVAFKDMLKLTSAHPSDLILAGERLQQLGFIAFNPLGLDSLMQLQKEGREHIKATGLDKLAEPTLAARILQLDDS